MNAFFPTSLRILYELAAAQLFVVIAGFAISRSASRHARFPAWALVIGGIVAAHFIALNEGAGLRMLAICAITLTSMKCVVALEARLSQSVTLGFDRWLLFCAWPGMRPAVFAAPRKPQEGAASLIGRGVIRLLLGAALIALARQTWILSGSRIAGTALALPGISLVFHFGAFNIAAGFFRWIGFACEPQFVAPLFSKTLDEFWSRRWNIAFSDMSRFAVYRPLVPRAGKTPATLAAFLFSGLLHEIAISLPSRAGYGLPLLYFAIHGAGMLIERALAKRGKAIDKNPVVGRVWTLGLLALPMAILFHPWFLAGVVWPMVGIH